MSRRLRITGSVVVVTGAGSGIGRATALRAARSGAEAVACVDIDESSASAVAEEITAQGAHAGSWACDVADAEAVGRLAEEVERQLGPVDVLVNNAGVGIGGPFLESGTDDWDWLIGVNLNGVAYGCHAFGAGMIERRRGQIVNVASGAAYIMSRDLAAYCASKAAVLALSRCLRAEWGSSGVGVSTICPGVINTPIASHSRIFGPMAGREERIARAFRFGHSPDLVARAILRAAERNDAVVPVGFESELAYRLLPLVPGPVQGLLARAQVGRVL